MKERLTGKFVVVTLHPAIDRTVEVSRLRRGGVVNAQPVLVEPAGKGINITHTLANLGHDVLAGGFLGRAEAEFFLASFPGNRVTPDLVEVRSPNRENITIIERDAARDTHLLVGSLRVSRSELKRLFKRMERGVGPGDWAVFAGSCAAGVRRNDYVEALRICKRRGAMVCVDSSGPMLSSALRVRPWLIKPNCEELAELAGRRLRTQAQILRAAKELLDRCAHVLVSLGADGAVLVTSDDAWYARETRRALGFSRTA